MYYHLSKFVLRWIWITLFFVSCSPPRTYQITFSRFPLGSHYEYYDLWVATQDGKMLEPLSPWLGGIKRDNDYTWLTNGNQIYVWFVEISPSPYNYILADLQKNTATCITCDIPDYSGRPIPSPAGDKVVISTWSRSSDLLYLANYDGTGAKKIVEVTNMVIYKEPTWSPDGQYIAFPADVSFEGIDIYRVNSDGNDLISLTEQYSGLDFFSPQWSPRGDKIALLGSGEGTAIYKINIDGTGLERIADWSFYGEVGDPGSAYPPQWSPDGSRLTFPDNTISGDFDIFIINADGTGLTNVTNDPQGDDLHPVWSLDGQQIAFESNRDGNWEIYVMNADGSNPINISNSPETADQNPQWRPVPEEKTNDLPLILSVAGGVLFVLTGIFLVGRRRQGRIR